MITEYRKARAEGMRAIHALQAARYAIRMAAADFPRYVGAPVTMPLPRGERIEMRLEYDSDASVTERFDASVDHRPARDVEGLAPDWWQDRDGLFYVMGGNYYGRRHTVEFDSAGLDYYRAQGMARHDAWLKAREDRERVARAYRDAMSDGYVGYVVTLFGADGEEVTEESVWGFEASDDYAGTEAYEAAQGMAAERAKHWARETEKARERIHAAGVAFTDLAHEYRRARQGIGPAVCDAIRVRLESLRAQHRDALRVIVGGAA